MARDIQRKAMQLMLFHIIEFPDTIITLLRVKIATPGRSDQANVKIT